MAKERFFCAAAVISIAMGLNLRLEAHTGKEYSVLYSPHFMLFYEASQPPAGILNDLEGIHAKLLLDLVSFAPWARDGKTRVVLYKDSTSYHQKNAVSSWAAGHVDLSERTIYCYDKEDLNRTLAHEMAHLFFEDYFLGRQSRPPLWLTEGVATLMEWDYGMEEARPLKDTVLLTEGLAFREFLSSENGGRREGEAISKWYLQAYSLTKFLMRRFSNGQFVELCRLLAAGQSLETALGHAYGLQMATLADLERLWRQDMMVRAAESNN